MSRKIKHKIKISPDFTVSHNVCEYGCMIPKRTKTMAGSFNAANPSFEDKLITVICLVFHV